MDHPYTEDRAYGETTREVSLLKKAQAHGVIRGATGWTAVCGRSVAEWTNDVATENMRVNLHMKADAKIIKVRTKKVHDNEGEGLIFQFFDPGEKEAKELLAMASDDDLARAIEVLYEDLKNIYERARAEVDIPRSDGKTQKYAAVRFLQQIEKGRSNNELVPTVARIVRKSTTGFGHLEAAGRPDLMVEMLVIDPSKPYHRFFTRVTIETGRRRMEERGYPTPTTAS